MPIYGLLGQSKKSKEIAMIAAQATQTIIHSFYTTMQRQASAGMVKAATTGILGGQIIEAMNLLEQLRASTATTNGACLTQTASAKADAQLSRELAGCSSTDIPTSSELDSTNRFDSTGLQGALASGSATGNGGCDFTKCNFIAHPPSDIKFFDDQEMANQLSIVAGLLSTSSGGATFNNPGSLNHDTADSPTMPAVLAAIKAAHNYEETALTETIGPFKNLYAMLAAEGRFSHVNFAINGRFKAPEAGT
uniref:Variant surface glycoprotein n=1 Tax=Trypanosoma brucei TaxID=5691 RepID=A0A1V0FYP3_9TRYP|nr:variant surface glycoprotein [Trypanosoma brucei]